MNDKIVEKLTKLDDERTKMIQTLKGFVQVGDWLGVNEMAVDLMILEREEKSVKEISLLMAGHDL